MLDSVVLCTQSEGFVSELYDQGVEFLELQVDRVDSIG